MGVSLARENNGGRRVRRTAVIGSIDQYLTGELAQAAVNGFRVRLNKNLNHQSQEIVLVSDLVDHSRLQAYDFTFQVLSIITAHSNGLLPAR